MAYLPKQLFSPSLSPSKHPTTEASGKKKEKARWNRWLVDLFLIFHYLVHIWNALLYNTLVHWGQYNICCAVNVNDYRDYLLCQATSQSGMAPREALVNFILTLPRRSVCSGSNGGAPRRGARRVKSQLRGAEASAVSEATPEFRGGGSHTRIHTHSHTPPRAALRRFKCQGDASVRLRWSFSS